MFIAAIIARDEVLSEFETELNDLEFKFEIISLGGDPKNKLIRIEIPTKQKADELHLICRLIKQQLENQNDR